MYYAEEHNEETRAVCWISLSDMFLLCSIMLLAVSMYLALDLNQERAGKREADNRLAVLNGQLKVANLELESVWGQLEAALLAATQAESARVKERERTEKLACELAAYTKLGNAAAFAALLAASKEADLFKDKIAELKGNIETLTAELMKLAALKSLQDLEIERLNAALASSNARIADLDRVVAKYRELAKAATVEAADAKSERDRLAAKVLKRVDNALLQVEVTGDGVPEGFDLNLFVEDPRGNVCCILAPAVYHEGNQTGMLVLNQDVLGRSGRMTEIFYSNELIEDASVPYRVYAMIRHKDGLESAQLSSPIKVSWRVEVTGRNLERGIVSVERPGVIGMVKSPLPLNATSFRAMWPMHPRFIERKPLVFFTVTSTKLVLATPKTPDNQVAAVPNAEAHTGSAGAGPVFKTIHDR